MPSSSGGQSERMIDMGGTSIPDWALLAVPEGDNIFFTMIMSLIQLLGFVGVGKGVSQVMKYFKPNAQNPPPSLAKPMMMIIFGMFSLIPTRVYSTFMSVVGLMGWG